MRRLGYSLDRFELRGSARRHFVAVTLPRNAGRLAAWSLRQRRTQMHERPPVARLVEAS
jgi:hypothetical protein